MKKYFWPIFIVLCFVTGIIFLAIIVQLFKGDSITYTDTETIRRPTINKDDPSFGSTDDAFFTVVVYSDFACSGCAQTSMTLREIFDDEEKDMNKVLVWKDFPNTSLNDQSYKAAIAAQCAARQNAFWEYHDMLMANQRFLTDDIYKKIAEELNLGMWRFNRCLNKEKTANIVNRSIKEGQALQITATPTMFINGSRHTGIMNEQEIGQIFINIEQASTLPE